MSTPHDLAMTLRIAIADALKEAGHDGLAEIAEEAATLIERRCNVIANKTGEGIGASLEVWTQSEYVGYLAFHIEKDWQVVNLMERVDWSVYDTALKQAREQYPNG